MSIPRFLSNLAGTLRDSLRIGRATLDASGLTAARTHTLPDRTGTLVPSTKAEVDILRMTNVVYVDDDTSAGAPPQLLDLSDGASNWYSGFHFKRTTGTESYGYFEGVLGGSSVENGLMFFVSVDPASLEKKVLMHDSATPAAPEQTIITPDGENLFVEAGMCVWLRYVYDATLADPGYWVVDSVAQVRSFTGSDGVTVDTSDSAVVAIRGLSHRVDDITAASGDIRFLLDKTPYQGRLAIYDDSGARMKLASLTGSGKQRFLAAPASGGEVYTVDYLTTDASPGATIMDDVLALTWATPDYDDGAAGGVYASMPSTTPTGGVPPYSYALFSGDIPDGLSLDPDTAELTGTATVADNFGFVLEVTDSDSPPSTATTGTINVAIEALDPFAPDVVSLLRFEGADGSTTFTDDTGKTWTANGDAQIDTSSGYPEGLFDGNDWIATPDHADFEFAAGEFTLDWFGRFTGYVSGQMNLISKDKSGGGPGRGIIFNTNGSGSSITNIYFLCFTSDATYAFVNASVSLVTGVDYWIEASRDGNTLRVRVDGVEMGTVSFTGTIQGTTTPIHIGATNWGGSPDTGVMARIRATRITRACRNPGSGTVAVPTFPLPSI